MVGIDPSPRWTLRRRAALRAGALGVAGLTGAFAFACRASGSKRDGAGRSTAAPAKQGESPRYGGVINQRLATDPPSFDQHQVTTYAGVWPTAPCFNQLVQFDPAKPGDTPGDIVADLAERWEQADPTTIVFSLKKGVKFHDGSDFTAEDVKVQLDWVRNPPQGKVSPRQAALSTIDAIETADGGTVRLRLKRPTPSLLMNLASHYFAIGQARDIVANGEVSPKLTGTGPFKLKSYQRSNLVELEKNPAYHVAGRPYLDGLRFYILPDLPTALTNFSTGQYHLFYDVGFKPSDLERLKSGSGGRVETELMSSTLRDLVFMNARRKPYNDVRVRQAISLALDRDAAITVVKEGSARRGGYMAPGGAWAIPESDVRRYDGYDQPNIERAKQLLAEAGVGTLVASATSRTDFKDFAEFVRDALAGIGINVKLNLADTATAQPVLQRGEFDIGPWLIAINVDDPDATFSEIATSGAVRNWSAVKDPRIDALYDRQSQTLDFNERRAIVQDLERQALSQYQVAVMFFEDLAFARLKSVRDFSFHSSLYTNRRMESVWLQQ